MSQSNCCTYMDFHFKSYIVFTMTDVEVAPTQMHVAPNENQRHAEHFKCPLCHVAQHFDVFDSSDTVQSTFHFGSGDAGYSLVA